jgi:hypothetical protein
MANSAKRMAAAINAASRPAMAPISTGKPKTHIHSSGVPSAALKSPPPRYLTLLAFGVNLLHHFPITGRYRRSRSALCLVVQRRDFRALDLRLGRQG